MSENHDRHWSALTAVLILAYAEMAFAAVPAGTPSLTVQNQSGTARLSWTTLPNSPVYDVVRGSLSDLLSSGGAFTTATTGCLQDDQPATTFDDSTSPPANGGFFYLVRGVNCDGSGTYDSGGVTQIGLRDAEIDSSGRCLAPPCTPGTDTDGDRLDNCLETGTGFFCGPTRPGTNSAVADTDGDYIRDGDEVLGTLSGLDLPGMGANPVHKDVFLEYDWFADSLECAAHSHQPTQAMVDAVTAAFSGAPNVNVDGATGIAAHHDRGQGGLFTGGNLVADADGVLTNGVNNAEFVAIKTANFASNRNGYFHYVLLPHRYNTNSSSSGQAELPGDDLIVSLYCAISTNNVARTIVHEIGHNFGLRHGGNTDCNYKPNYNSVMNYKYQFPGIDNNCDPNGNGVLDYSRGTRITLNENALDENLGTCGTPAWDWNGNSVIENPVVFDINSSDTNELLACGGTLTTLQDFNDWAALVFTGLGDGDFAIPIPEIITCDNPAPEVKSNGGQGLNAVASEPIQ